MFRAHGAPLFSDCGSLMRISRPGRCARSASRCCALRGAVAPLAQPRGMRGRLRGPDLRTALVFEPTFLLPALPLSAAA